MSDVAEGEDAARLPAGQFLTKRFPVLTYGATPDISTDDWGLRVWGVGLAEPVEFDWEAFNSLGAHETTRDFHCVTTWSKYDVDWDGVKFVDLAAMVRPTAAARFVIAHGFDDYTTNVPLADCLDEDVILADRLYGEPLPLEHGGPMRLIVPALYAWKSAKFLSKLVFIAEDQPGFWEQRGYHDRGDPWSEERYG